MVIMAYDLKIKFNIESKQNCLEQIKIARRIDQNEPHSKVKCESKLFKQIQTHPHGLLCPNERESEGEIQ